VDEQLSEFGRIFTSFLQAAVESQPDTEPEFGAIVREHLGADPGEVPIIGEEVHAWDQVNLQLGLEALFKCEGRSVKVLGIGGRQSRHMTMLSELIGSTYVEPASIEYENLPVGPGRSHPCMSRGLALISGPDGPAVIFVHPADGHRPGRSDLGVEVMTPVQNLGTKLLADLRELMLEHNVFRGQNGLVAVHHVGRDRGRVPRATDAAARRCHPARERAW
jgi:hypothetical protein